MSSIYTNIYNWVLLLQYRGYNIDNKKRKGLLAIQYTYYNIYNKEYNNIIIYYTIYILWYI